MRKKRRTNTYHQAVEAAFLKRVRSIPPAERPGLLRWLLTYPDTRPGLATRLRHRLRAFYGLDPTTGRRRRLE